MTDIAAPPAPVPAAPPTGPAHDVDGAETRRELERLFHECGVERPFQLTRFEKGHRLEYAITGVHPPLPGRMTLEVEKFVGGGFAGQVYRVRVIDLDVPGGTIPGLAPGGPYAIKILTPPKPFARGFRDFLYFLGYQGHFAAQVNPASVRVGVLWQKLIRRAAAGRFGRPDAVCDTYATFHDATLKSFGEINEWIDGRIWKFEVDDRLFERWKFEGPPPADVPSAEFVHKHWFMRELVDLLHEMGAGELARQYEWWTCKSQPNALKRRSTDDHPGRGLTAVDFRAGLTLLPFLPMSPADVALIGRGLARGRLVQFDRSDRARFERFIAEHRADFADLAPAIAELREREDQHWAALPDVTGHGLRLVTDRGLRASVRHGTLTAWRNLGLVDDRHARRLEPGGALYTLLYLVSLVPLLGGFVVKLWGDPAFRHHIGRCVTGPRYLWRAMRADRIEVLVDWHREGRVGDAHVRALVRRPVRFWLQRIFLSWLAPEAHRSIAEPRFGWARVRGAASFMWNFLRQPSFRAEWLLEQVRLGQAEGMLSDAEAERLREQVKDPYTQKYLRYLAIHLCTVPITHVVMLIVSVAVTAYCLTQRHLSWTQSLGAGAAAAAVIQLLPISPGSIARGLVVLVVMIRERDVKNYLIAAPVSFFHVVGYLAFPLQMVNRNPTLARFMAGRWARQLVNFVPVFGESGGLLEHGVFDAFFNFPVSVARRFRVEPLGTTAYAGLIAAVIGFWAFLGYAWVWEARQPAIMLHDVTVTSVTSYRDPGGGELHRHWDGMRVRLTGLDLPVDFPDRRWNHAVAASTHVDAVVKKGFFGNEYHGVKIAPHAG